MSLGPRFDAWLTTQPEAPDMPLPGDPFYPRCGQCGAFLKRKPESVTSGETTAHCDGQLHPDVTECGAVREHQPHEFTSHAWDELHRTCARCGHPSTEIAA